MGVPPLASDWPRILPRMGGARRAGPQASPRPDARRRQHGFALGGLAGPPREREYSEEA